MSDQLASLAKRLDRVMAPCLWHGTDGGAHGPQPDGGACFCSQCERRHGPALVHHTEFDELRRLLALCEKVGGVDQLERRSDASSLLIATSTYDEDGYCRACGNGSWKFHMPECVLADLRDVLNGVNPLSFYLGPDDT